MIDQRKVATMTKLAIMENREGKEMIRLCSHRKVDYVLTEVFKGFIAGTVTYALGLVLWFCYLWEDLNDFVASLDVGGLLWNIGLRYIIFMALYILVCVIIAYRRHTKRMGQRYVYLSYLKDLRNIYHLDRQTKTSNSKKRRNDSRRREEA